MQVSDQWPVERRLRAGESGAGESGWLRHGQLSSRLHTGGCRDAGCSTTNGTRALQRVQDAPAVLAAFVNRAAVVQYVHPAARQCGLSDLAGKAVFTRRYGMCRCDRPQPLKQTNLPLQELAGNDELIAAIALYFQWQDNLLGLFHQASHGKRLLRLDCHEDLKYCPKRYFGCTSYPARTKRSQRQSKVGSAHLIGIDAVPTLLPGLRVARLTSPQSSVPAWGRMLYGYHLVATGTVGRGLRDRCGVRLDGNR